MTGHFTDQRCPKCGANLLSDGKQLWCSFVGGGGIPPCDYGLTEIVFVKPEDVGQVPEQPKSGATLIAEERRRQVEAEEWTAEHDDLWDYCELAMAAMCYVAEDIRPKGHELCYRMTNPQITGRTEPALWPWHPRWWKPKDRIRNLVRAGALIAAEIDRLQRALEVS